MENIKRDPTWLLKFKSNTYSQKGEDGIIEKILEVLPKNDKWCVEFGAWDGIILSNTLNLINKKDYSAILIEGSKTKFKDLKRNFLKNPKVTTINRFVGFNEKDNLDQILKDTLIPDDFDFCSIDIDGNDYHVWKVMSKYMPKVICIEFNPTIPTEIKFKQPPDYSVSQGASLLSLVELGKEKGYKLISVLHCNAFFVKDEYFKLFQIDDNSPGILRTDLDGVTYMFTGYDGKVFLKGSKKMPWHGIEFNESKIQQLPKFLRKYPGNYSKLEKMVFDIYRARSFAGKIKQVLLHILIGLGIFGVCERLFNKFKKRLFSFYHSKKRLRPPNSREEKLINNLRSRISSLPISKDGGKYLSEDLWTKHCIELKNTLLDKDPRGFLKWEIILKTMYHQVDEAEFYFLKSQYNWEWFKNAMVNESPFFYPEPYFAYGSTNSNTVHHAYHIAQLLKYTNINFNKLSTIFEFGGGYGNMCRLFFNLGFKGNYTIFDLPLFSELQRYYLSSLGLPLASDNLNNMKKTSNIILMSDTKNILDDFCNKGLFIATWSISEVPIYFRKKIFKILGNPDYFLLAYQNNFEEVDNVRFFKSFCAEKKNYLWHDFEIEHLKGNRYLIGEKIK